MLGGSGSGGIGEGFGAGLGGFGSGAGGSGPVGISGPGVGRGGSRRAIICAMYTMRSSLAPTLRYFAKAGSLVLCRGCVWDWFGLADTPG
jgi:hypothetical protein